MYSAIYVLKRRYRGGSLGYDRISYTLDDTLIDFESRLLIARQ
jgi:hypothetical protein